MNSLKKKILSVFLNLHSSTLSGVFWLTYFFLPLILRVFPPNRKHSQSKGRGVLEASTNTLTLWMSIPRLSKMGWMDALQLEISTEITLKI